MEPALYGLLGTLVGGSVTAVVTWLSNRHDMAKRQVDIVFKSQQQIRELAARDRDEKIQRYAKFLSANWQAERYVEEIIDALDRQYGDWSGRVNEIIRSPEYRELAAYRSSHL